MKELSIEEKAKHYDEAYKKVAIRFGSNVADEIFPELKESEDERMRKAIIKALRSHSNSVNSLSSDGFKMEDVIAWLEKQGEQKIEKKSNAWSEEDEQYIIDTLNLLSFGCSSHSIGEVKDFLKSLKDRYTWKPSEDELKALAEALSLANNCGEECAFDLRTLYKQLKKLRDE